MLGDLSKLKRIYKSKNTKRPKNSKTILKVKSKSLFLKKQKCKQAETSENAIIRITNKQRNKVIFLNFLAIKIKIL